MRRLRSHIHRQIENLTCYVLVDEQPVAPRYPIILQIDALGVVHRQAADVDFRVSPLRDAEIGETTSVVGVVNQTPLVLQHRIYRVLEGCHRRPRTVVLSPYHPAGVCKPTGTGGAT